LAGRFLTCTCNRKEPSVTVPDAGLDWLADRISEPTARGIAACLTDLIRSGELARGARLPTVRKLAGRLGVSPATVSEAWSTLRHARVISTQRRNGTVVIGPPNVPHPVRYERLGNFGGRPAVDLTVAAPDPSLLPRLDIALAEGLRAERLNDYSRETITPRLRAAAGADWPFDAQDWLAVGGGYEGVQLTCQAIAVPGDRVAVEHPSAARLLDIAEARGVTLIPVTCDEHGPRPEALAAALRANPVAFIYQPRAHTPCGHAVPAARSAQLAELLRPTSLTIIEDDGLGQLSAMPLHSIGAHLPGRTVLIRSFSKSHGPDLRLAVLGGAAEVVDRVRVLRSFGTGWTSRILQDALAYLLTDEATIAAVTVARDRYVRRRGLLADALRARGVSTANADGLMLWVPVAAESEALVTLAAHGIAASPGSRYCVSAADPHLRVATARLPEDPGAIAALADILALAAQGD
jgi:DNA-binding transcriptional MocR family regulator